MQEENIARTTERLIELINKAKPETVIIFDEAGVIPEK